MSDYYDRFYGHPQLPAGYNSDPIDGDEVDGAGTNWAIEPLWTDTFLSYPLVLITPDMLEIFETGCPDYVVQRVDNVYTLPAEVRTHTVPRDYQDYIPSPVNNTIVFPREVRKKVMRKSG